MLTYRLNAARRALHAPAAYRKTVTEAAMSRDFYHLSRFAGQYRSLFGELPSQTLADRPA
jgi:AraC-like DNA-binding protein